MRSIAEVSWHGWHICFGPGPDISGISAEIASSVDLSAEAFFAILKRGVMDSFHSVSEQHLQRYVDEFAFRWNTRSSLGIEDAERANQAIKGAAMQHRPRLF